MSSRATGLTASLPPEKKIRQLEGHSTFDLHGHEDYVEALPVAGEKRSSAGSPARWQDEGSLAPARELRSG